MSDLPDTKGTSQELSLITQAVSPSSISYADDSHLHIISDDDLEALATIKDQFQAAIALTALGVFIPSLPSSIPALASIWNSDKIQPEAAIWLCVSLVSLVLCIVCGINGVRRRNQINQFVGKIRKRENTIPLKASARNTESEPLEVGRGAI
tara:strand:+ start:787 stop:1242 length:456 start_codon:yes stop_codon:yes gene_type:complete